MPLNEYESLTTVKSADELRSELVKFVRRLEFNTVTGMTVIDRDLANSDFFVVDNTPESYLPMSSDHTYGRRDPVMQHCKHSSLPVVWNRQFYIERGEADMWDQMAGFGYKNGIALAVHLPKGRHFMLGADRDQALPSDAKEVRRIVAELQLLAVYAQDVAIRLFVQEAQQAEHPALSAREIEALQWTMEGKTAWEVGQILNISEHTAVAHVNRAMRKLDCINKTQTVIKALRLGVIK